MSIRLNKILAYSLVTGVIMLLCACSGQPTDDTGSNNAGSVTLKVGDSATCYAAGSCRVYLIMPEGSGDHVVKQSGPSGNWKAGTFPAQGQKVLLGEFFSGRTEFTIEGMDVPSTWVTVVSE